MTEHTAIQWTDHTWNPWRGCSEVSPGCDNCYAREWARRNPAQLGQWGDDVDRVFASDKTVALPFKWHRDAGVLGVPAKVFTGSMMDFFEDRDDLIERRREAVSVMLQCQQLRFQVLTKRPQNIDRLWPKPPKIPLVERRYRDGTGTLHGTNWPLTLAQNVWIGTTVENQKYADLRIPQLMKVDCHLRFLSCEPLIGRVEIGHYLATGNIDWVIVGGESRQGGKVRICDVDWVESLVGQCREHKVPVFVKQMGSVPVADGLLLQLLDKKGGDISEWPDWLQIREFPRDPMRAK